MKAIKVSCPISLAEVPNLKNMLEMFVLNNYNYAYVGSIGKKAISSDVDVVIETTVAEFFNSRPELQHNAKISHGFNLASIPLLFNGKIIQLDIFFTEDLKWSEFILGGTRDRNMLLMAAVICKTKKIIDHCTWEQMNIRIPSGLWHVIKTDETHIGVKLKHPKIIRQEFITNSPEDIFDLIRLPWKTNIEFDDLFYLLKDNKDVMLKFEEYKSNL